MRKDVVDEVDGSFRHALGAAGRAEPPLLAGERHGQLFPAVVAREDQEAVHCSILRSPKVWRFLFGQRALADGEKRRNLHRFSNMSACRPAP
jgi:hypothetical protein